MKKNELAKKSRKLLFCDPDWNSADHICGTGIPHLSG